MNKYIKCFYEHEEKNKQEYAIVLNNLTSGFIKQAYTSGFVTKEDKIEELEKEALMTIILSGLSDFSKPLYDYVKFEIIDKLSKPYLIRYYMEILTNNVNTNAQRKLVMESFKKSGLIQDICYKKLTRTYEITDKENRVIPFQRMFQDSFNAKKVANDCHNASLSLIKKHIEAGEKTIGVTVEEFYLIDFPIYHSFVIYKGMMQDSARNIIMPYEDYQNLINPTIISFEKGEDILKEIDELKKKDIQFCNNNLAPMLNYAMQKQMQKKG